MTLEIFSRPRTMREILASLHPEASPIVTYRYSLRPPFEVVQHVYDERREIILANKRRLLRRWLAKRSLPWGKDWGLSELQGCVRGILKQIREGTR